MLRREVELSKAVRAANIFMLQYDILTGGRGRSTGGKGNLLRDEVKIWL